MTHMIDSLMYVGDRPWHGLGKEVLQAQTSSEAIISAGLGWTVNVRPLYTVADNGQSIEIPGHYATVRDDNDKVLGVVQGRYRPAQNKNCFDFFDSVVGGKYAMYHTAGSLDEGKKVWLLAKLPNDIVVKGNDVVEKYLLLANSHDGTGALRMLFTPTRVVCMNTLRAALSKSYGDGISIRHTQGLDNKVEQAKKTLGFALEYYKKFEVKCQWMVDTRFTDIQMNMALEKLFPSKTTEEELAEKTKSIRNQVKQNFEAGIGIDATNRGTLWSAWNAITEYTSHQKTVRNETQDKRLNNVWFGSGAELSMRAFDVMSEIAQQG